MGKNKIRGVILSVLVHAGVIGWLVLVGMWNIHKVKRERIEDPPTVFVQGGSPSGPGRGML